MRSSPARAIALVSGTRPLLFLVTVVAVALCVVLAAVPVARAQLAPTSDAPVGAGEASGEAEAAPAADAVSDTEAAALDQALDAVVAEVIAEQAPPEVAEDTEVTAADLGAKESRVLPGNPFYAFKRFGWGMRKAFTFDPVKKAALDLQHANQELADAQKRAAATGANEAVVRSLERAQGRLQSISDRVGALQDAKATNAQGVEALMEHAATSMLQQQKVMERIAHEAPADLQERIAEHRDGVLAEVGTFMGNVDAPDAMRQRFERAMEQQRGSAFKHFNSLEVLQRIEATVPEQAKDAIRAAQDHAEERIAAAVTEQPEQAAKFEQYVQHLPGDQVRQFEALDDVRAKLPQEFVERIDKMKTRAVEKFNTEFAQRGVEGRARMMEAFRGGDVEAVGLAEQFKNFVPPEARQEIEKHENASIEKFKQQFVGQQTATGEDAGAVADEAKRLMEKVRTNPEPADFIVLQKLKEKLTPEQQAFVQGLEHDGARRFEEQFRTQGAQFLERFTDPNAPQSLEVLENLRGQVPGIQGIDRAIEVHRRKFQEHLQDLEDPETLGHINDAINGNADLKAEFEKGDPSFFLKLEAQRGAIEQRQAAEHDRIREQILQQFEGGGAAETGIELSPKEQEQIRQGEELFRRVFEGGGFPGGPGSFGPPGFGPDGPQGVPFGSGDFMPPGFAGRPPDGSVGGPDDGAHRDAGQPVGDVDRFRNMIEERQRARVEAEVRRQAGTRTDGQMLRDSGRTLEEWQGSSDSIPNGALSPELIQKIDEERRKRDAGDQPHDGVGDREERSGSPGRPPTSGAEHPDDGQGGQQSAGVRGIMDVKFFENPLDVQDRGIPTREDRAILQDLQNRGESSGETREQREQILRAHETEKIQREIEAKVREQRGDKRRALPPLPPAVQKNFEDRQEVRTDRVEGNPIDGDQGRRDERRDAPSLPTPPRFDGGAPAGGGGFGPMPGGFVPGAGGGDHGGFGAPPPPPSFGGEPLGIFAPFATVIALLP